MHIANDCGIQVRELRLLGMEAKQDVVDIIGLTAVSCNFWVVELGAPRASGMSKSVSKEACGASNLSMANVIYC